MTRASLATRAREAVVANARGVMAGLLRMFRQLWRSPDHLMALVTAPMLTLVFMAIMLHGGREDLAPYAVLAPSLVVLWQMALQTSGDTVESERENGSLEPLVATPSPIAAVIGGQITGVTMVSQLGFLESWLVAGLVLGVWVEIHHPVVLVLSVIAAGFATASSALVLAALFVTTRSARTLQNVLTYPFYILGGVIVPVAMLPEWLQPVTRLVFLSWTSDLLRDSLMPAAVSDAGIRLAAVVLLGLVALVVGRLMLSRALSHARRTGSIGYA